MLKFVRKFNSPLFTGKVELRSGQSRVLTSRLFNVYFLVSSRGVDIGALIKEASGGTPWEA